MRLTSWDIFNRNTSYLLYPTSLGLFISNLRPSSPMRFYMGFGYFDYFDYFDPFPDPRRSRVFYSRNNENFRREEKIIDSTNLVIPINLYFSDLMEQTRLLPSTSYSYKPYSNHQALYNFSTNRLVYSD
jgi:hypothetical protein